MLFRALIIFICFYTFEAQARNFYSFYYTTEKIEKLESILKLFILDNATLNSKSPTIHKTRRENPKVKNWKELKKGTKVRLYFSDDVFDMEKYKKWKDGKRKERKLNKKEEKKLAKRPHGFKSSIFYMTSAGNFNQKAASSGINIDFSQNSPYTFGFSGLYYPERKPYSFSSSLYYSKLSASASNLSQDVIVPAEIGINFYVQHDLLRKNFSYYGGFDYESFSTFNTGLLNLGNNIQLDENKVLYLTAGIAKLIRIGKIGIFSKLSLSKSLSTTTSVSAGGVPPTKKYSGIKVMGYLNYKFHRKWFAHTLLKFHTMDGPDKLSVFRYGLGFGYIIN